MTEGGLQVLPAAAAGAQVRPRLTEPDAEVLGEPLRVLEREIDLAGVVAVLEDGEGGQGEFVCDEGIIVTTGGYSPAAGDLPPGARLLLKPYRFEDLVQEVKRFMSQDDEADRGTPIVPQGLTTAHTAPGGTGAGEVAVPLSEPDKS